MVPAAGEYLEDTLAAASPDLLRTMIREFAQRMMDAEVEQLRGAGYGEISGERVNTRNGYRARPWDTRAGSIELAVPRLRQGSYFPDFLLDKRRRAERALTSVVATSYLLGVSTRRVEKLAEAMGITSLSKSQISAMAAELDVMVEQFRSRPLDGGPYTFVWIAAEKGDRRSDHRGQAGPTRLSFQRPRWDGGAAMAQWTAVLMGHLR
ncbi:transposase [Nonomuraea purpurea]|uniref:Mutator family transposase n=1 Tax=Nonomuraea purpurea TaxID=1849276 RepID=A0ABV8GA57_9ACTN